MRASHLIVVDGQKGGVGKSTVARLLLAYLARRGVGFRAYDADGIVGDLGRYYSGVTRAVDLASVSSAGVVLDDLVEGDGPGVAVVDLGAGSRDVAHEWLHLTGALAAAQAGQIRLTVVFVIGDTSASPALLREAVDRLRCPEAFVVTRNLGLAAEFPAYEASQVRQQILAAGGCEIHVPALARDVYQRVDALGLPFDRFAAREGGARFSEANWVAAWLAQAEQQLEPIGARLGVQRAAGADWPGANRA